MYDDHFLEVPKDADQFWLIVNENFEFARHVLEDYPLQSKEDAIEGRLPSFLVIRYQGTSEEMNQRDHFYKIGNDLIPEVARFISSRTMDIEFCHQWSKLMFCHGFIASYVFEDADAMATARGNRRSAEARSPIAPKTWLAHVHARPEFRDLMRARADEEIGNWIWEQAEKARVENDSEMLFWLRQFLNSNHKETGMHLRSSFQGNNLSKGELLVLQKQPIDGLPPIPD